MVAMLPAKAADIIAMNPPVVMPAAAMDPPVSRVTQATPRLAPDVMPSMEGEARGFLNAV